MRSAVPRVASASADMTHVLPLWRGGGPTRPISKNTDVMWPGRAGDGRRWEQARGGRADLGPDCPRLTGVKKQPHCQALCACPQLLSQPWTEVTSQTPQHYPATTGDYQESRKLRLTGIKCLVQGHAYLSPNSRGQKAESLAGRKQESEGSVLNNTEGCVPKASLRDWPWLGQPCMKQGSVTKKLTGGL